MTRTNCIIWGVTGGIALYKPLDAISALRKAGHDIHVVMTDNAQRFIQPVTFEAISANPVLTDTFQEAMTHISLSDRADILIIAPATYNIIGKLAHGIADDLLTTIAAAATCRKLIAPAMNVNMYQNPILQQNLSKLIEYGYEIIEPDSGMLACGYEGIGRLRRVEDIIEELTKSPDNPDLLLKGKRVLVTAGGTLEPIDPVRYLGNRSSGRMGISFAEACRDQGGEVTLVYSQVKAHLPKGIRLLHTDSARDMLSILQSETENHHLIIMAAAVGDYRVEFPSDTKMKKTSQSVTLKLIENPDIIKTLTQSGKKGQIFVGFAAETDNHLENATKKLKDKKLNMIIVNDVSRDDIGFNSRENAVTLIFSSGDKLDIPRQTKYDISQQIIREIHARFYAS